ncbi:MAG: GntR family transcriptional regulator [Hungatella sp.]|nr:GntR family transcriptional regulator [Hungatella sp.]
MLDQNAATPLYEQLKLAIKEGIKTGQFQPGTRLPSEAELEKLYDVSRITVRRAVKELCEEEILARKQGKGTFVLNTADISYKRLDRTVGGFHDSLVQEGKVATVDILEKSVIHVNPSYARDLGIDEEEDVVCLKRLMYADGVPVMIDTAYIPEKRFPGIYDKLEGNVALFRLMEQGYGVNLEHYYKVLKVRKATKDMARLLNCHQGDPMFDLFKITYNDRGIPQSISVSILKGEDTYYVISSEEEDRINQSGLSWKV